MTELTICGWDIGGAHLKVVCMDIDGRVIEARQIACPLWRGVEHLRQAMLSALEATPIRGAAHAVTMTGELCDNFESRAAGVREILGVVGELLGTEQTRIYAGSNGWLRIGQDFAIGPQCVGSANWLGMAEAVAMTYDNALLIDVGSTTTDIIPIMDGAPRAIGSDDASRLSHDELVYSGVVRTSLMAICSHVPFAGVWQRVASEHFANMADIYRVLGELPEHADVHATADDAPKTVTASSRRICRMLGRDLSDDLDAVRNVSRYFAYCQFDLLQRAVLAVQGRLGHPCEIIVAAGVGAFVVRKLAHFNDLRCVDMSCVFEVDPALEQAVMTCAPAAAVAKLAQGHT